MIKPKPKDPQKEKFNSMLSESEEEFKKMKGKQHSMMQGQLTDK